MVVTAILVVVLYPDNDDACHSCHIDPAIGKAGDRILGPEEKPVRMFDINGIFLVTIPGKLMATLRLGPGNMGKARSGGENLQSPHDLAPVGIAIVSPYQRFGVECLFKLLGNELNLHDQDTPLCLGCQHSLTY